MEIERRVLLLERQNTLLKLLVGLLAILPVAIFSMGAGSFNQDHGELLGITKIQLVDEQGKEVAVIDGKGINFSGKSSQIVADKIVGRRSVAANANPENSDRYAELGVTSERKCYMELGNKGTVYHHILSDSGVLESNF
ncbi:MAG TPA: hypothetical protein VMJ32_00180 [Pirellulales bacterium]|nr:hypothetical protein [Pirellulales bacterium]